MNTITCPKCSVINPPNMAFCTNCGNPLASAQQNMGNTPNAGGADLPPTMLSYQPNFQPNPATPPITPSTQPNAPKKGGKGLMFGLIGCGALLVLGLIGLAIGIVALGLLDTESKKSNTNTNIDIDKSDKDNKNSNVNKSNPSSSSMLAELQKLKQVGAFKQTDLKTVSAKDFFPSATDVAQATYTNGSKYVVSTLGKFSSNQDAFDDFDTQIKNVKANGGNIYSNETKNGTKAALYKYNGYYFIEACGDAACSRNNSDDLNALRSFATSFGSAVSNASYSSTSTNSDNPQTISAGVVNGKATNLVQPAYPSAAKAVRASGAVNVQVTIDESGNVVSAKAVSGHPLLRQSAEQAALSSKFTPTVLNGNAVKVTGFIVYNFVQG